MQVFVGGDCTMIAAPVQGDVDGVPKGSHFARVPPMGYTGGGTTTPSLSSGPAPPTRSSTKSPADKPPSTGSPHPRHTTRLSLFAPPPNQRPPDADSDSARR